MLNRDVDPGLAKIVVRNSAGKNVTQGTIQIEGTNMVMPLAFDLPKDTYTVWWRGNRADGEAVGGAWQFSYGKGNWTDVPNSSWSGNANEPGEMASTDPNGEPTTAAPTSETPTASASPTSASPTTDVTPTPTAPASTGAPATGGDGGNGWLIGGVVAVVVAAGAGTAVVLRKRRDQSD